MTKTKAEPLYLLDVNVLIALTWRNHIHHALAHHWVEHKESLRWASCALTQLAFVRISSNPGILPDAVSPRVADAMLRRLVDHPGHHFLAEAPALAELNAWARLALIGHRQVTDGYLLALADHHDAKLATFDTGLPMLLADAVERERMVVVID